MTGALTDRDDKEVILMDYDWPVVTDSGFLLLETESVITNLLTCNWIHDTGYTFII